MDDRAIGRRTFLGIIGAGVVGLFVARDVTSSVSRVVPSSVADVLPLSSGWRIFTVADEMPNISSQAFALRISGLVDRPSTLSMAQLQAVKPINQTSDFHCVTGWTVEDVRWVGVRVADLLDHVGVRAGAGAVRFISAERPYEDTLTLKQARLDDVILAWDMDGGPLPRPHGGPLRLVMPKMYGYKSVKWVTGIEVRADVTPGYWEQRGYDSDAWVGRSNGF